MSQQEPTGLLNYLPQFPRTIRRKGYMARRRGKTIRVRPGQIRDVGFPGKGVLGTGKPGIGKLREGDLSSLGYSVTAKPSARHRAVDRAVAKYGKGSTLRKLNAVAVYTRRTSPKKSRTFKSDVRYVQKKYY
jgi:hypothetical protein